MRNPTFSLTLFFLNLNHMSYDHYDNLFYNAPPHIMAFAKELRKNMTPAEKALWDKIRNRKVANCKFRRQHPIDIFIADFYCHEKKLVIEIDGEIHNAQKEHDINRTAEMENYGIRVIRFTNDEIENELEKVVEKIEEVCGKPDL